MRIPLSPMDYYFFRRSLYTIQIIFEYQGQLNMRQFNENLEKALGYFNAVGSRIKIISDYEIALETGHSISVRSRFIEKEPSLSSVEQADSFLDPVENAEDKSLMNVLVTNTPSRSFVGFSFSHILGDGTSFFNFLNCLSKLSCSEGVIEMPSNRRDLLQINDANEAGETDLFKATGYVTPRPKNPEKFSLEVFRVSNGELNKNKAICADQGAVVTSNDILMADLAKRFHRDIPSYENQFIVRCPVDYRNIFGLPAEYFGNAVRDAVAIFEVGEIDELSLPEIAVRIRQSIQGVDRKSIEKSLTCLDQLRRKNGIRIFENIGCPGLLVSNLSKFPIPKIDLGLGPPIGFHHASLNPRLGLILPAEEGVEVRFKRPVAGI